MLQIKKCKLCRRKGQKLFLKGERCNTAKCSFTRRSYAPGKTSKKTFKKLSDYAIQLQAKQACKHTYKIRESVLKNYYLRAVKSKTSTGEKLIQYLELRLDNVVYQLGIANSRSHAQQLIGHGHILINNNKVDIPSCQVKTKDKINIDNKIKPLIENTKKMQDIPIWLKLSKNKTSGEILKIPNKNEIKTNLDIELIVEFYSR